MHIGYKQHTSKIKGERLYLAYLILAIRRARVDRRRQATYLITSRNCARVTPGGLIEPENFDRHKRREHGGVVVTNIHSLDYCDKS